MYRQVDAYVHEWRSRQRYASTLRTIAYFMTPKMSRLASSSISRRRKRSPACGDLAMRLCVSPYGRWNVLPFSGSRDIIAPWAGLVGRCARTIVRFPKSSETGVLRNGGGPLHRRSHLCTIITRACARTVENCSLIRNASCKTRVSFGRKIALTSDDTRLVAQTGAAAATRQEGFRAKFGSRATEVRLRTEVGVCAWRSLDARGMCVCVCVCEAPHSFFSSSYIAAAAAAAAPNKCSSSDCAVSGYMRKSCPSAWHHDR